RQGVHRGRGAAPDQGRGPGAQARPLRDDRVGDPAAGDGDRGGRRGDLGVTLADARPRDRDGLRRRRAHRAGLRADDRYPGTPAQGRGREEAHLQEGALVAAAESYPDELRYHSEHDWARIEGDEAVLGITWFVQDARGE